MYRAILGSANFKDGFSKKKIVRFAQFSMGCGGSKGGEGSLNAIDLELAEAAKAAKWNAKVRMHGVQEVRWYVYKAPVYLQSTAAREREREKSRRTCTKTDVCDA